MFVSWIRKPSYSVALQQLQTLITLYFFFWQYQLVLVKEKGLAGAGFQSHCRMQAQTKLTAKRGMNPSQNTPSASRILAAILEVDAHDRGLLTASTAEDPREKINEWRKGLTNGRMPWLAGQLWRMHGQVNLYIDSYHATQHIKCKSVVDMS